MALAEPNENDKVYKIDEVDFLINDRVLPYTKEKQLDYISSGRGQGFVLDSVSGHRC